VRGCPQHAFQLFVRGYVRVRHRPDLRGGIGDLFTWTCANAVECNPNCNPRRFAVGVVDPLDSNVEGSVRSVPPNRRKRAAPAPRTPLGEFGKALLMRCTSGTLKT